MGIGEAITIAAAILALTGCGQAVTGAGVASGVSGRVLLGPQCPVEVAGHPCEDQPAAHVTVIVSEQIPGDAYAAGAEVARTITNARGRYQVVVPPGEYVVSAEAGMSCELMDARVTEAAYTRVDVPCDTGIR